MQISLEWLQSFVSTPSAEEAAKILTSLGLEVEGLQKTEPLDELIVVGKVLETKPHPNANKLTLCKVDIGKAEPLAIVCGAQNVRPGLLTAVTLVGSTLPDKTQIKEGNIRGEASQGMLASEKELALTTSGDGIIELGKAFAVGKKFRDVFVTENAILTLNITPNRGDCLSYLGVARELSAKLQTPLKKTHVFLHPLPWKNPEEKSVTVQIANGTGSDRFVALRLQNVAALPSPFWLRKRLEDSGLRPINILVDASNYVMLELGEPNHAYDARKVKDATLGIRFAKPGEKLKLLDGKEISLTVEDLVVADAEKALGLGGIMGGENSQINPDTTDVIIEAAHWSKVRLRKTSKRLGVKSDALYRFERGIDGKSTPTVVLRVAEVILAALEEVGHKGATIVGKMEDCYPNPGEAVKLPFSPEKANQFLGLNISKDKMHSYLKALGFEENDSKWLVPSWRNDFEQEVDLHEEIGRLEGFDQVPSVFPVMLQAPNKEDPFIGFLQKLRINLAHLGLCEVITYPFVSGKSYQSMLVSEMHPLWPKLKLANPINEEEPFLRTSLLPRLLEAVVNNRNKGVKGSKLFEASRVYFSSPPTDNFLNYLSKKPRHLSDKAFLDAQRPHERYAFSGMMDSPFLQKDWQTEESAPSFFHAKAFLEKLWVHFGLSWDLLVCEPIQAEDFPFLHPTRSAVILDATGKNKLGWVGEIHPRTLSNFDLGGEELVAFELDAENFFELVSTRLEAKQKHFLSKFPPLTRDLAFIFPEALTYQKLTEGLKNFSERKFLNCFELFDLYQDENLKKEGKKSFALTFSFQALEKTLSEEDVEKELKALILFVEQQLHGKLRG